MNGLVFIAIVASIFGVQGKIIVYFERSFGTCFGQYSSILHCMIMTDPKIQENDEIGFIFL